MMTKTEIDTLKREIDLIDLAGRYTTLHRAAAREMEGPCPLPRCTAMRDGFHVHADGWWKCYTCHPKRADAIEFVRLVHGCSFSEAVAILGGEAAPVPAPGRKAPQRRQDDPKLPDHAVVLVQAAQDRLMGPDGAAGHDYLAGRGLTPDTWRQFGLGFDQAVAVPGTQGRETAPAISIPWRDADGRLTAVRYRFLTVPDGGRKVTSMGGSRFAGHLFGADQVFPGRLMTLFVSEGEFNAMAAWQAAGSTRLDVVSLGSESGAIPDSLIDLAGKYGAVVAWLDEPEHAARIAAALPGSVALKSLGELDANDQLQRGRLGGLLAEVRLRLCKTGGDREALLWNLYDGGLVHPGLDTGTAGYVRRLAGELGRDATISERAGHWLTGTQGREANQDE